MSSVDDLVKRWLKEKFLESHHYFPLTMGGPESIEILSVDSGWDCGCYSEYTRDDTYQFTALIKSASGESHWTYGRYIDLPRFMQEIADMDEPACEYMKEEW